MTIYLALLYPENSLKIYVGTYHDAAENAAVMHSLLGCCKTSDVNPREWLTDVFTVYQNIQQLRSGSCRSPASQPARIQKSQINPDKSQQKSGNLWIYSTEAWSIFDFFNTYQDECLQ